MRALLRNQLNGSPTCAVAVVAASVIEVAAIARPWIKKRTQNA